MPQLLKDAKEKATGAVDSAVDAVLVKNNHLCITIV